MKYKILLPLLVSVAFLNACKKDKSEVTVPGDTILESYYPGESMEIKELAIYTQNTVITDQASIQNFLNRNANDEVKKHFFPGISTVPVPASNTMLNMLNDNRVNVNGVNMQIVGYRDSIMLVREYTSTPIPSTGVPCQSLSNYVAEYNPFTDCPDANCSTYRKVSPLIVNGLNYYAPLLTYIVKSDNCVAIPNEMPAINVLNHNLQSLLGLYDSVLVQYAKLPMIKKAKD
ncbi:hypothetical protein [Niastella populi]|uniref:Uncharacterized protein n=1 Tax=Niastella populi TaxID=550983 RepID=A0A1V9FG32_9BACT|nr:hypothetical protein [Niastella populi]OQP57332.1 hypothetical protein A4R26_24885 [Niastella populi]